MAELSRRPLLALTSGDLGSSAADLDWKLSMYFRLGELWDAIVLIDEADVHFQKRDDLDIERNRLVSGMYLPSNSCSKKLHKFSPCVS